MNPTRGNDDLRKAITDSVTAVGERTRAEYDGVMGLPPEWLPPPLQQEFQSARAALLDEGYAAEDILKWVAAFRRALNATSATGFVRDDFGPPEHERNIETLRYIQDLVALGKNVALDSYLGERQAKELAKQAVSEHQSQKARRPRARAPTLQMRAFRRLLKDQPDITAEGLLDQLRHGRKITYDAVGDDDVELSRNSGNVVIKDLSNTPPASKSPKTVTIKRSNLASSLSRARKT